MTTDNPSYVRRDNFRRRLEPFGDRILHGAGQDPKAFKLYFDAIGESKPALYMTYIGLNENIAAYFQSLEQELSSYLPHYLMPQIGVMMTGGADETHHPEQHYEERVAAGDFDDQIETFCMGLKRLQRPAFIRIGFEFNGPWFGYAPKPYKAAWIRIVQAFHRHQLDNVATVWCYYPLPSKREHEGGIDRDYLPYYPGDAYVDWWSIDLFGVEDFTADNTLAFMADAQSQGFPVMIGESTPRQVGGVQEAETTWNKWFIPYFNFIRTNPTIKAFCYISWDWREYPAWQDWGDARVWANEELLSWYKREISSTPYFHAAIQT